MNTNEETQRDLTIDVIRGVAIFLMVLANLAGTVFIRPYPGWGEIIMAIGSFVPTLFIFVAGMMVALTLMRRRYMLKHYIVRMGSLLFVGAIILDVIIAGRVPFLSFGVLYLIGVSLPLTYLFLKLPSQLRWLLIGALFFCTPLLQNWFGFVAYPLSMHLVDFTSEYDTIVLSEVVRHFFVDGWFPIFPWLGVAFLGAQVELMRQSGRFSPQNSESLWGALFAIVTGVFIWILFDVRVDARPAFSELIYPPTLPYLMVALGQVVFLLGWIKRLEKCRFWSPLIVLGQSSLLIYWLHFLLFGLFTQTYSVALYVKYAGVTLVVVFGVAYLARWLRRVWRTKPRILTFLLGV